MNALEVLTKVPEGSSKSLRGFIMTLKGLVKTFLKGLLEALKGSFKPSGPLLFCLQVLFWPVLLARGSFSNLLTYLALPSR